MSERIRENVHEETRDGVALRVFTIHGTGVYQAEWCLRGSWYAGYAQPTVDAAIRDGRSRLAWDSVAAATRDDGKDGTR